MDDFSGINVGRYTVRPMDGMGGPVYERSGRCTEGSEVGVGDVSIRFVYKF